MSTPDVPVLPHFPSSAKYHSEWIKAGVSGAANPLWLTEWLTQVLDVWPGMRVLDLGCGRAMSSIFLHRELGVQVWAVDLWFSASENLQRIRDAGAEEGVFPLQADARSLPFARDFFDAIVCIDAYAYFGTDEMYLPYLVRLVKPGGLIAIAGATVRKTRLGPPPEHLRAWWTPDLNALHSSRWWHAHWEKSGIVDVQHAEDMPDGWKLWLAWLKIIAPENTVEIAALEADRGRYLGYARVVARRKMDVELPDPITTIPGEYARQPLLRA